MPGENRGPWSKKFENRWFKGRLTIRYDAICYFNVRSKANMSQLRPNL